MIPNFDFITFDEATHTYFNTEIQKKVPSVTTILNKLKKPFNKEKQLPLSAAKVNLPVEVVAWEWDMKRDIATNYGTRVHEYIENYYNKEPLEGYYPSAIKYLNENADQTIKSEFRVGNHLIAGTFDNLSMRNGEYVLKDWKTNKEFETKSMYKLLPPFQYLDKSELTIYSLQLSIYRKLLGLPISEMEVIHFGIKDYTIYKIPYMEREVNVILKQLENDYSATCSSDKGFDKSIRRQ